MHTYQLDGTKILKETWGDCTLIPLYDNEDSVCGIIYDGAAYYFYKNLQGDIIEIANKVGTIVARYSYDAWGKVTAITDGTGVDISNNVGHVANANPFRYRGYYYDTEIGMYYLQSRYYDPTAGRFLCSDSVKQISSYQTTLTNNLFGYCNNSPIVYTDARGYSPSRFYAIYKALVLTNQQFANESKYVANSFSGYVSANVTVVRNSFDFLYKWNHLASKYDVVIINCHASYNYLQLFKLSYASLRKIKAKAVILLGCNAGHYNYQWTNVAKKLCARVSGYVMASDGTVTSNYSSPSLNQKFTSKADETWKKYNRKNARDTNYGWVIYRYTQKKFYWWSTNIYIASANEMIAYLCKVGFVSFDNYYVSDFYFL